MSDRASRYAVRRKPQDDFTGSFRRAGPGPRILYGGTPASAERERLFRPRGRAVFVRCNLFGARDLGPDDPINTRSTSRMHVVHYVQGKDTSPASGDVVDVDGDTIHIHSVFSPFQYNAGLSIIIPSITMFGVFDENYRCAIKRNKTNDQSPFSRAS